MADLPDDLTDVGSHHGNEPPPETGQTVRSPEGPDPSASDAHPAPALFQVVRGPDENRVTVQAHSARAEVPAPDEGKEMGQYRTVEALREALETAEIDGWAAVFEDTEADRVLVEPDVTADHTWIGQPRYATITLFADPDDATAFAEAHERPTPNR